MGQLSAGHWVGAQSIVECESEGRHPPKCTRILIHTQIHVRNHNVVGGYEPSVLNTPGLWGLTV